MGKAVNLLTKTQRPAFVETVTEAPSNRQANRVGKWNCSAWISDSFRSSIKAVQMAEPSKKQQDIIEEALNLLFEKYGVPTVRARD